jgi:hypothetical protein
MDGLHGARPIVKEPGVRDPISESCGGSPDPVGLDPNDAGFHAVIRSCEAVRVILIRLGHMLNVAANRQTLAGLGLDLQASSSAPGGIKTGCSLSLTRR